jgi:hypothetical protein
MILFAYSAPLFSQLDLDIYYDAEGANASHFPKILRIIVKGRYYGYTPFAYNYTPQLPTITPPNCLQLHPLTTYSYTPPHRVRLVVARVTPPRNDSVTQYFRSLIIPLLPTSPTSTNDIPFRCEASTPIAGARADSSAPEWRSTLGILGAREGLAATPDAVGARAFSPCQHGGDDVLHSLSSLLPSPSHLPLRLQRAPFLRQRHPQLRRPLGLRRSQQDVNSRT